MTALALPAAMRRQEIIDRTCDHARKTLAGDTTGHGWRHTERVRRAAVLIGEREGADLYLVQLGALLHDIADWKFSGGDAGRGGLAAQQWLEESGAGEDTARAVKAIVDGVSYKGAEVSTVPGTLEGKVVQDADRLDALGAIGIGRTFAYGGSAGSPMHDPDLVPVRHTSFKEYRKGRGSSINHFYEKLLLLRDRMHTRTARKMARERHAFLEVFLERFLQEWEGGDLTNV